ncbi:MAG: fluoride efflux transporter CrcB [Candidatus Obscuribacterales bacterium]|nr:fluoride efflux transporter CrcB [Candidatus Obscuribacterales bacterium]
MNYFLIFVGAGIGGVFRFLCSTFVQKMTGGWMFPLGTFAVNMLGCLLIGYLMQLSESRGVFQAEGRLFVFVGVLGGFTTFSSFGLETFHLLRDGEYMFAIANAVGQVVLGLVLVWLGIVAARLLHGG